MFAAKMANSGLIPIRIKAKDFEVGIHSRQLTRTLKYFLFRLARI